MAKEPELTLVQTRIAAGVWEGALTGAGKTPPQVQALQNGREVEGVTLQQIPAKPGAFAVQVPIPAWALNEGVQTFLIRSGEATLAQFTLVAGQPLDADIRAEIGLLRAELDLLKRAFQRHARDG